MPDTSLTEFNLYLIEGEVPSPLDICSATGPAEMLQRICFSEVWPWALLSNDGCQRAKDSKKMSSEVLH